MWLVNVNDHWTLWSDTNTRGQLSFLVNELRNHLTSSLGGCIIILFPSVNDKEASLPTWRMRSDVRINGEVNLGYKNQS